jgi:hypothetical protein
MLLFSDIQSFKNYCRCARTLLQNTRVPTSARQESRTRLSHIVRCRQAIDSERGAACANETEAHDWQDNDFSKKCPECKGDTPPVTP